MANFLCDSRKKKYFISFAAVSMLTQTAVSMGAEPYGWVSGMPHLLIHLYTPKRNLTCWPTKQSVDPNNIMNPGKFFGINSKFFNIPAFIFRSGIFQFFHQYC